MSNETIKSIVRRLTPVETSRLMGFPDGYLFIDGQDTPDSPMYKACGNSWGVNSAEVVNIRTEIVLRELGIVPDGSPVNYATTCSGVEAHSLSVDGRNWQAHFYSEIEPFPCKVLAARYPTVPNLGDMTKVDGTKYKLDVFSGGTPCQSFSVAGKRHGLGGSTSWDDTTTRSSLAFHWVRIGLEAESPILLWENVPGVYSSSEGKDFPWLVHFLNDHGFVVAWRTFDVQWQMTRRFPRAIPQRRRRCWLVAYKGEDWRIPARILFERTSKLGSFAPDRVVNGVKIERKDSCDQVVDLFGPTGPSFNKDSRADMIPFSEMPDKFVPAKVLQFMRKCGTVGFCGNIFKGDADPDNIDKNLRDNIGNAGIAKGDFIITMKTPEWNAGIQLSEGEECPREYDGTVCGLSDILEPMREGMSKYFLSSRACEGILRRADKRGKDLPDKLEKALHAQIENWSSGAFGDVAEPATQEDGEDDDSGCEDGEE